MIYLLTVVLKLHGKIYKTIIIGGGTGGLMAARYLDGSLLIERKENIGDGPVRTGEGISYTALKMNNIEPDKKWISCELNAILRIAPNGKATGGFKKSPYAYIIDRSAFEKSLAAEAKAEIVLNSVVTDLEFKKDYWEVKTNKGKIYKSKYIIGADGTNSIVRRKVFGEDIKLMGGLQYLMKFKKDIETNIAKIYLNNDKFLRGYAWFFPKSRNTANVGICCNNNLKENFNYFLEKIIKPNYGDYEILENRSGVIPKSGVCKKVFKDNAFLIGDAAGLTDPIFEGGMSQSMLSAQLAVDCIKNNKADLYEAKIKSLPFSDPKLVAASKIFYSLNNETLNELAEVLEGKSFSGVVSLKNIFKILITKKNIRKNFFKILSFLLIWKRCKDYLW